MAFNHLMNRRKAKKRGWEGPYRYRTRGAHAGVVHGWIVKRGHKWLHFYAVSRGHMKVRLTDELLHMVKVA